MFGSDITEKVFAENMRRLASAMQRKWKMESLGSNFSTFSKGQLDQVKNWRKEQLFLANCQGCPNKARWNSCFNSKTSSQPKQGKTASVEKPPGLSPAQKKQQERRMAREMKASMEKEWVSSEVDNAYADRTSLTAYNRQRMRRCFEPKTYAQERTSACRKRKLSTLPPGCDVDGGPGG